MSSNQKPSRKRLMLLGIGGLTLAALLVANGLAARSRHEQTVASWTETAALPVVSVFQPLQNAHGDTLRLPAHLEAWSKAPIHARVNGYLKSWQTDIGSKVKAGQILAVIDSPDLDQQVAQTRAHMLQEQANATLAATTASRWQNLLASHSVSRQEADEKRSDAAAAKANAQAAEADYARLSTLEEYKTIRAPFAGTVAKKRCPSAMPSLICRRLHSKLTRYCTQVSAIMSKCRRSASASCDAAAESVSSYLFLCCWEC